MYTYAFLWGFIGFAMIEVVAYHGRLFRMACFLPISWLFRR